MIKFYFIKCEYRVEEEDAVIYLWGRYINTKEKKLFKIIGFEPYFYVNENEEVPNIPQIRRVETGFKSLFGEFCKKIVCKIPEDIKELKKLFKKHYEADIPFTRRFLINKGIRRYFNVPESKTELHHTEVIGE